MKRWSNLWRRDRNRAWNVRRARASAERECQARYYSEFRTERPDRLQITFYLDGASIHMDNTLLWNCAFGQGRGKIPPSWSGKFRQHTRLVFSVRGETGVEIAFPRPPKQMRSRRDSAEIHTAWIRNTSTSTWQQQPYRSRNYIPPSVTSLSPSLPPSVPSFGLEK